MDRTPSLWWKCAAKTLTCRPSTFRRSASKMRGDREQDHVASHRLFQNSATPPLISVCSELGQHVVPLTFGRLAHLLRLWALCIGTGLRGGGEVGFL